MVVRYFNGLLRYMFRKIITNILIVFFIVIVVGTPVVSYAYVSVRGYYRKNGTYVRPYVRSNPNGLKYDNYGYKSSQGRYNKSYGTKGSNWDTPTWDTDPNYYKGKSLYESKSIPSTYYKSYEPPTYNYGSIYDPARGYMQIKTIPSYTPVVNSYKINSDCRVSEYAYLGDCYTLPSNARKDIFSGFACQSGYEKVGYGTSTICKIEPKNGVYIGISLFCDSGYRDIGSDTCIKNTTTFSAYGLRNINTVNPVDFAIKDSAINKSTFRDSSFLNVRLLKIYKDVYDRINLNKDKRCYKLFDNTKNYEEMDMCRYYKEMDDRNSWSIIDRTGKIVVNNVVQKTSNNMKTKDLQKQISDLLKIIQALKVQINLLD